LNATIKTLSNIKSYSKQIFNKVNLKYLKKEVNVLIFMQIYSILSSDKYVIFYLVLPGCFAGQKWVFAKTRQLSIADKALRLYNSAKAVKRQDEANGFSKRGDFAERPHLRSPAMNGSVVVLC
jgi:hypothetical protein